MGAANGTCKECDDNDVSEKCLPGQAFPSETQQSCVCHKCIDGWIGDHCDIEIGGADQSSSPTDAPTTEPTSLPCITCDDRETNWQLKNGLDCTTDTARIDKRCNKNISGQRKSFAVSAATKRVTGTR